VALPFAHEAERQLVVAPGYAHAIVRVPSHVPAHDEPSLWQAWRAAWGAPVTAEQLPSLPATSQAWHCPLHAWLQHTSSTQMPELHVVATEQACPFVYFATHDPASQKLPTAHPLSSVQVVVQAAAPQM
jgi:hypothetical protein